MFGFEFKLADVIDGFKNVSKGEQDADKRQLSEEEEEVEINDCS